MATIVDSYSETNEDTPGELKTVHPSSVARVSAIGQSFTGDGQNLDSCKLYLKKTATPGNIIARLYAHTGTYGTSSLPTGAALDSSSTYATTSVTGSYALFEFTGFTGYTLANGTKYCIDIETYDGTHDDSNYISAGADSSSPSHGGSCFYYYDSDWVVLNTWDLCFYVYGVTVGWTNISHVRGIAAASISHKKGVAVASISHVKGVAV